MNPKSLAEIVRNIQILTNNPTKESIEELDFYNAVFNLITDAFVPGSVQSIVPVNIGSCPLEKAMQLARSLDMHIVVGHSNTVYLCWSKGLDGLDIS